MPPPQPGAPPDGSRRAPRRRSAPAVIDRAAAPAATRSARPRRRRPSLVFSIVTQASFLDRSRRRGLAASPDVSRRHAIEPPVDLELLRPPRQVLAHELEQLRSID